MMKNLIRLPKFISQTGAASRRAAEKLIFEGRVKVNGVVVKEPGRKIEPGVDRVEIDNHPLKNAVQKKYYILFKPKGYLTTVHDPFGRPTVMDLFPDKVKKGLFPVGRLDKDTEGLLLLTNDGEMAFRLTHPRFKIKKKYLATVKGVPSEEALLRLKKGIFLEEGLTANAEVKVICTTKKKTTLLITIYEGKKRQVKRMCEAIGHPVVQLKRLKLAFLDLKGLRPGDYRSLSVEEIQKLAELVGLET